MRNRRKFSAAILVIWLIWGHLPAQTVPLFRVVQQDSNGIVKKVAYRETTMDRPENVLVVYNINYTRDDNYNNVWDGYEIAEYYRRARNIPLANLAAIKAPTRAQISRAEFDASYDESGTILGIRQQLENILNTHTGVDGSILRTSIKYIVLTKGVPHKVNYLHSTEYQQADYSSVDAGLAMMFNDDYDITWYTVNPYYNQDPLYTGTSPFIPEFYTNYRGERLSFLVSRLDAYTVEDVKSMIDRAVLADTTARQRTFILDGHQKPYDRMSMAHTILTGIGAVVHPDPWEDNVTHILSHPDTIAAIVGHGVHSGLSPAYLVSQYNFNYVNGAIFSSYESFNGASFDESDYYAQGQVADFIKMGGSGGIGNVYEPWSSAIANESIFLPAYYSGYTFVEAAYMSLRHMDWTAVIVGDPLMRIGPEIADPTGPDMHIVKTTPLNNSPNQATTTVAEILFSQEIDTLRLPVFIYQPAGDTLQYYVDKNYLYLWSENPLAEADLISFGAESAIYSVDGDSIDINPLCTFATHQPGQLPVPPTVYKITPQGIGVGQAEDLRIIFSQAMLPVTLYPLICESQMAQTHHWTDDRILTVLHQDFLPGTTYHFDLCRCSKSVDEQGFSDAVTFSFETAYNYITYDIDGDAVSEYALNLNQSLLDGYEVYADSGGIITSVLDTFDLNGDNQNEFFLRTSGNPFPSIYWNPNLIPYTGYIAPCDPIDDDEDGIIEYAFDETGRGYYTKVYDPNDAARVRDINFVLAGSSPANEDVGISIYGAFNLEFSKPVNYDDILNNISFLPDVQIESIQTDRNGRGVIINPADTLQSETLYRIFIDRSLSAIDGDSLFHDYFIEFTTESGPPVTAPFVQSFYPGDSVHVVDNTPTVRFIFSAPMDTSLAQPVDADSSSGIAWSKYWAGRRTLYLFPLQELPDTTNIRFNLSPQLRGTNTEMLLGKRSFSFVSGRRDLDAQAPGVFQVLPTNGQVISEKRAIRMVFTEWVNQSPDAWLDVTSDGIDQPFSWRATGSNYFSFTGDPFWIPQSGLQLTVSALNTTDNNNNTLNQDLSLEYFVLGESIKRDIDNDGIAEFVLNLNEDNTDGLEFYQDPGGTLTSSVFAQDIDGDSLYDFIISDEQQDLILTWFPTRSDSGIIGFTEVFTDSVYHLSTNEDDLVELQVDIRTGSIAPATPAVRHHEPAAASFDVPPFSPMVLKFNMVMDPFSVVQAIEIHPATAGNWSLSEQDSRFIFDPTNGWEMATIYTIRLNPGYRGQNSVTGSDSLSFAFRVSDSLQQAGEIVWQFPGEDVSAHSGSNYFIGFSSPVDTNIIPGFTILQGFNTIESNVSWISASVLQIDPVEAPGQGEAVLRGSGSVKFLSTPQIELNTATSFMVDDSIDLQIVRSFVPQEAIISAQQTFPFVFNQPLNPDLHSALALFQGDSAIQIEPSLDKNYLKILPHSLGYGLRYTLELRPSLRGINNASLEEMYVLAFETLILYYQYRPEIYWRQLDDYLILYWPGYEGNEDAFELYFLNDHSESPDTLTYENLYNSSRIPSWLIELDKLTGKSFWQVRRLSEAGPSWSKKLHVSNFPVENGDILSVAVTANLELDDLAAIQPNFETVSQWDALQGVWKSSKYLSSSSSWTSEFILEKNRGIMARCGKDGFIVWAQSLQDTISISEPSYPDAVFRSFYNPLTGLQADYLASLFGNGDRIAVWDNAVKAWNEAVYDSIGGGWVNNFLVPSMTAFYSHTANGFHFYVDPFDTLQVLLKEGEIESATALLFPSRTELIHFNLPLRRMEILAGERRYTNILGCGINFDLNTAYINLANLPSEDELRIRFYDTAENLIETYTISASAEKLTSVPGTFEVKNPYPNPFNSTVNIAIRLPVPGGAEIKIFNILGQMVYRGEVQIPHTSAYLFRWQTDLSSGVYLVNIQYKTQSVQKKVLLIK